MLSGDTNACKLAGVSYLGKRSPFDILNSNCAYLAQDYKTVYLCPLRWFLSLLTDEMVITQQIESLMCSPTSRDALTGPLKTLMLFLCGKRQGNSYIYN